MMHFPLFQISPLFSKFFLTFCEISEMLPFPDKISYFHPPKFLTTFFLVINHKFRISPLFRLYDYISPLIREISYSPLLLKIFPPLFSKYSTAFYILYV